ncbi:MAG TPA: VIT and VWA domain-containing protein, partial [Bacteroidales bacterium]|nr:VIT and VWA domain-containing protein [Bacteroidales bacterium]
MKTILALDRLLIVILLAIFLQSEKQPIGAQQPLKSGITPVMKITNSSNGDFSIRLDEIAIDIQIIGRIAISTLDMTYYNPNSRVLEGEFNFPLDKGQTVSRFALDIGDELREGVVVEKEKGRTVFEAIERRKVDPGLLEMTEGNNFRARIFPIPANGSRRIVIAVEQELSDVGNYDLYNLPILISEQVRRFSIHAEILKNEVIPGSDNQINQLIFRKRDDTFIADFEQENVVPEMNIALNFPSNSKPVVYTATRDPNTSWFYLNCKPEMIQRDKKLPGRVTLLWDNSNSAHNRDIPKEMQLLDGYFRKIGNLTVTLVPFNIKTEKPVEFKVRSGNWEDLRSVLNSLVIDGGTSFGELDPGRFNSDEILLFSDGLSNYEYSEPVLGNVPVYTINSSHIANHSFLLGISQETGGSYIDLSILGVAESLKRLETLNLQFISAVIENGSAGDILPSKPCQLNGTFTLAGILSGKTATVVLNFGFGSTVFSSSRITIHADNSTDADILRRLWAEKKIAELSLNSDKNKPEITKTGKEFGIITPNTSLLVLETIEDYVRYEVIPPKGMQAAYFQRINSIAKKTTDQNELHFSQVLENSEEQTMWWNTKFPVKQASAIREENTNEPDTVAVFTAATVVEEEVQNEEILYMEIEQTDMESESRVPPPPPPPSSSGDNAELREIDAVNEIVSLNMSTDQSVLQNSSVIHEKVSAIQINAWNPETPYMKVLEYANEQQLYKTYLKLKQEYGTTPSFFIDASDFFASKGKTDTAIRILSNLAELKLEVPQLLRVLGRKLILLKEFRGAIG